MNIAVSNKSHVQLVQLQGDLRLGEPVNELKRTLEELFASGENRIVLNLANVPMVDSSGIGVLVKYLANARTRGGTLKLVSPSDFALKTLRVVGVLNLFEIYKDESEALHSFAA